MMVCVSTDMRYTHHFFFFNDTATTEIYTLSLHDALPILTPAPLLESYAAGRWFTATDEGTPLADAVTGETVARVSSAGLDVARSEEHTSELQSRQYLVCRLLLEKKKS